MFVLFILMWVGTWSFCVPAHAAPPKMLHQDWYPHCRHSLSRSYAMWCFGLGACSPRLVLCRVLVALLDGVYPYGKYSFIAWGFFNVFISWAEPSSDGTIKSAFLLNGNMLYSLKLATVVIVFLGNLSESIHQYLHCQFSIVLSSSVSLGNKPWML